MIDLSAITADANPRIFPGKLLRPTDSACCFFAAGFHGKNDVIHIRNAGITECTLVDTDVGKLEEMAEVYPAGWNYVPWDAYEAAESFIKRQRTFDVVTVDPWAGEPQSMAIYELPTWLALTKRLLVIGIGTRWFENYHVPVDVAGFNEWAAKEHWNQHPIPEKAKLLLKRSDWMGGQWWLAFEKGTA